MTGEGVEIASLALAMTGEGVEIASLALAMTGEGVEIASLEFTLNEVNVLAPLNKSTGKYLAISGIVI